MMTKPSMQIMNSQMRIKANNIAINGLSQNVCFDLDLFLFKKGEVNCVKERLL